MKRTIWKFELQTVDVQEIELPMDFEPLMVDVQRGVPCLWALLDPHSDKRRVTFRVIGNRPPDSGH